MPGSQHHPVERPNCLYARQISQPTELEGVCQHSVHDQKREFLEPGLGVLGATFLEPYSLLPVNGQGREADSKIEKY